MGTWAGSPSFYVRLLRSGLSTFHTKSVFWIRDAIFLLSEINHHSQQRIKWSMCFSNLLKVSSYGQILDISTLKHESHHLRLRAWRIGAAAGPRPSISTLHWTAEPSSFAGFADPWPCEDSVFQLFLVRAPHQRCQLEPWQLDWRRSRMGCWKHQSETNVSHTMLSQRRGLATSMWASCRSLCPEAWGCLFPAADTKERTKQLVRSGENNPSFLRLPQPRGTRGHMWLRTLLLPCFANGKGFLPISFSIPIKRELWLQMKAMQSEFSSLTAEMLFTGVSLGLQDLWSKSSCLWFNIHSQQT